MPRRARAKPNRVSLFLDGPHITADRFRRAIDAFFALLDDVAATVTGEAKALQWIVSVEEGSIGLHADPEAKRPSVPVRRITETIHAGMQQLHERARRPRSFSDDALRSAKELATVADGKHVQKATIRWSSRKVKFTRDDIAVNVDRILGLRTRDYGSVEGQLQMVSLRGGPHFAVFDPVTGRSVECGVPEDRLREALAAFGKRVAVSGVIRYDEGGDANSIEADMLSVLPEDSELPTADEVYGILTRE